MKITHRNSIKRSSIPRPSNDLTSLDKEFSAPRRESTPINSLAVTHYSKRQTHPNIPMTNDFNFSPVIQDQSTVGYASTKNVFDSRKVKNQEMNKYDWKILTLKQIKDTKQHKAIEQKLQENQMKGSRKIFVSISKSNRESLSKQKRSAQPKLSQIGGDFTLLRSISNRRKIVDIVQFQLQENIRTNRFFCN